MELRYKLEKDMEKAPALIEETGREFEKIFGRNLGLVDAYRCDDAEFIFVTSGTAGFTARVAVDELRASPASRPGTCASRSSAPSPSTGSARSSGRSRRRPSSTGTAPTAPAASSTRRSSRRSTAGPGMPPLFGYIAGLGGRDITTADSFKEIAADAMAKDKAEEEIVWIGVKK